MISVIIPTFNRLSFLVPTLSALSGQTGLGGEPFEIILVDSGNDGTNRMVRDQFPHVRYLQSRSSRNRSALRNRGARKAKGEWLVFIDNDMIAPPRFLSDHIGKHQGRTRSVCLSLRNSLIEFDAGSIPPELYFHPDHGLDNLPCVKDARLPDLPDDFSGGVEIPCPWRFCYSHGMSLSRSFFLECGGFDEGFGKNWGLEDVELGYRLYRAGGIFHFLTGCAAWHQPHDSQSAGNENQAAVNQIRFFKKHQSFGIEIIQTYASNSGTLLADVEKVRRNNPRWDEEWAGPVENLVFGCPADDSEGLDGNRFRLGTYMTGTEKKVPVVRISRLFYQYDEILQLMILRNALIAGQTAVLEKGDSGDRERVIALAKILGFCVRMTTRDDLHVLAVTGRALPRLLVMIPPGLAQPALRDWFFRLALYLDDRGHRIALVDLEGKKDPRCEVGAFEPEERIRLDRMMSREYYHYLGLGARTILCENEFLGGCLESLTGYRLFPGSVVLKTRGFHSIKDESGMAHEKALGIMDESSLDLFSRIIAKKPDVTPVNRKNKRKEIVTSLLNSLAEDDLLRILGVFEKMAPLFPDAELVVRVPDWARTAVSAFPCHNEASRFREISNLISDREKDIALCKAALWDKGLSDRVRFENLSGERVKLPAAGTAVFIDISKNSLFGIQGYEALYGGLPVVTGTHKAIHPAIEGSPGLIRLKSANVPWAKSMGEPVSPETLTYRAGEINSEDLLGVLTDLLGGKTEPGKPVATPDDETSWQKVLEGLYL